MTHWLMAAPSVVYKGRLSSIPKYVVLTGGRGVPCRVAKTCQPCQPVGAYFSRPVLFFGQGTRKKTVSSTNASMKVALVLAKTPVQPANNTSVTIKQLTPMLLARVALAININVASLFQAFTLICRELRNVVKHAFLVLIFWDNKLLVIIFTLLATMVPCQEQQDCKWQTS